MSRGIYQRLARTTRMDKTRDMEHCSRGSFPRPAIDKALGPVLLSGGTVSPL